MCVYFLAVTLLMSSYVCSSSDICDSDCVCRIRKNQDVIAENVDCSYNPSILKQDYTLPSGIWSMDLSANNLTRIEESNLLRSKTMVELLLNDNKITTIDLNSLQLPELKILDLRYNLLEFIHEDVFKSVVKLEYLNLANNKFMTCEKLTFRHLSNLNELILDYNDLGPSLREVNLFDKNGFGLTHKIKNLSISGVGLNVVPDNFFLEAYDIRKLVISDNNLSYIFELPFTLEYLDLSDNPINDISEEDFADLPGLKELKLNNLAIKEVPGFVFTPLHGMINLELERNKNMTIFSAFAFGQEVLDDADYFLLERLTLKGSRLTTLDERLLEPFGQLMRLNLEGNPWRCDCKLLWLKKLQIQPVDYDYLRCAAPKNLLNSKIVELNAKYFSCTVNKHYVGVAIAAVSFCVILATIAMWLFVFLPRFQSRCHFVQNLYVPSAQYTVLPMTSTTSSI